MKKFSFPLERVLAWRHTQTKLEEAKLDRANLELRTLERELTQLSNERDLARRELFQSSGATGAEFQALEPYRAASEAQGLRMAHVAIEMRQAIAAQMRIVMERRRDAKLLERLREQQEKTWNEAAAKEVEQLAEESYLSQWSARIRRGEH
jgi:flagellar export protein FliJ